MAESPLNGVLQDQDDLDRGVAYLKSAGLKPHPVSWKSWDGARMVSFIQKYGQPESRILDVGCIGCPLLVWLSKLGFKNLHGCDLSPFWAWRNCIPLTLRMLLDPRIHFSRQNLEKTRYPSNSFDFITSLSVIEHGVWLPAYFEEMSRLLKPGGVLLTSTDYWPEPIDTHGIYPYGKAFGEMKIFSRREVEDMFVIAGKHGLEPIGPIHLSGKEKMVNWINRDYTFVLFGLKKKA